MKFFFFIRQLIFRTFSFSKKARSKSVSSSSRKTTSLSHTPLHIPKADKEASLPVASQKSLQGDPLGHTRGQLPVEGSELTVEHQQGIEGSTSEAGLKHQKEDLSITGPSPDLEVKVSFESDHSDQSFEVLIAEAVDQDQEIQHDVPETLALVVTNSEMSTDRECQDDASFDVGRIGMLAQTIELASATQSQPVLEDCGANKPGLGSICEAEALEMAHEAISWESISSNLDLESQIEFDVVVDEDLKDPPVGPLDSDDLDEETISQDDLEPYRQVARADETCEEIENHKELDAIAEGVNKEPSIQGAFGYHDKADHLVDIELYDGQVAGQPVQVQLGSVGEKPPSKLFATPLDQYIEKDSTPDLNSLPQPWPFDRPILRPQMLKADDQTVEAFLKKLETDDFEDLLQLKLADLEELFLKSLERCDYIGELPISRQFFEKLIDYLKEKTLQEGQYKPRRSLPTLLVISMVFFARYSEADSRAFWAPYAKEVWDQDNETGLRNICSKLFTFSRLYLNIMVSLSFDIKRRGDVVRPVYQHAIIPSYLQENFAEWLVGNFASLMHYSTDQLQRVLSTERSLDYVYPRLQNFIRDTDTQEAAARLVSRMTAAIALFNEEESDTSVENALNSNLERSLWRVIYRKLSEDPERITVLRKVSPQLTWRWSEEKSLHLHLGNVRSPEAAKPNMILWAHPDDQGIKIRNLDEPVYPWPNRTDRVWELEPEDIRVRGPLDGRLILLSEDYDLNKTRQEQEDQIILERSIPALPDDILFFRLSDRRDAAVIRDGFDTDGTWIIFSKKDIRLEDISGGAIVGTGVAIPPALLELGFIHATKVCLTLPFFLASHNQSYDKPIDKIELDPILFGDHKLQGMPQDLPPIFSSAEVKLKMTCNPDSRSFKRYILRIRQNGRKPRSHYLTDLMKEGLLKKTDQTCLLDLAPFIADPGHYTLDLRHNLKSMLDEPLQFAWLPDSVHIHEPDLDLCYSPHNPLRISIVGVSSEQVQPYDNEEYKKTQAGNQVEVTWPMLKGKRCCFGIYWEDHPIHLGWDVDRVSAWITGGGDAKHVLEGQEEDICLFVRGKPREWYTLLVEGLDGGRENYLNAKGELEEGLLETTLRDMLKASKQIESSVRIRMRDDEWRLFDYFRKPDIKITEVIYSDAKIRVDLELSQSLKGNYIFQIRNKEHFTSVETVADVHSLEADMNLPVPFLAPGLYILEIAMEGVILAKSDEFRVIEQVVGKSSSGNRTTVDWPTDRKPVLFQALTSPLPHTLTWLFEKYGVDPLLEHFEYIHTSENWLKGISLEESERRLLPAWVVLGHPLRFETIKHKRVLHIYPEQSLYGGKFGKGYADLKMLDDRIRVAAYWQSSDRNEYAHLWMRIPQGPVQGKYGELDPLDLWPAYQCKGCGELLASKEGTYLALPPSLVQIHQHGQDVHIRHQFLDTVYPRHEDPLEATISQYKGVRLQQAYKIEDTVPRGYLRALIEGVVQPKEDDMEVSVPVYWQDAFDFQVAVSELYKKLGQEEIIRLEDYSKALESVFTYFVDKEDLIPAYAAVLRILDILDEREHPYNIPRHILLLTMVLRTKAHKPIRFNMLMRETEITESDLISLVDQALTGCPKFFEWSMAWAELLFLHADS